MFEQEIICRDTCAAIQLLLLYQAAAAAVRCVRGAALLTEDAFLVCPKHRAWQRGPGCLSWGKCLHPRGIMLTVWFCQLTEVGVAACAICYDLCWGGYSLLLSLGLKKKKIFQWEWALICSLMLDSNMCVWFLCVQ